MKANKRIRDPRRKGKTALVFVCDGTLRGTTTYPKLKGEWTDKGFVQPAHPNVSRISA